MVKKNRAHTPEPGPYLDVVSIDPGVTNGWCVTSIHPAFVLRRGIPMREAIKHITWGEVRSPGQTSMHIATDGEVKAAGELVELCEAWPHAAIVVEDFILRTKNKAREAISPVRITSMLRMAVYPRRIWLQMPALAMTTYSDERLRKLGLYDSHSGVHARDAVRHNLLLLRRVAGSETMFREVWPWIATDDKVARTALRKAGKL